MVAGSPVLVCVVMTNPLLHILVHAGVHRCKKGHRAGFLQHSSSGWPQGCLFLPPEDTLPVPGAVQTLLLELFISICRHVAVRRVPSHFPKKRERKTRQFSIFVYQLPLLPGDVPQSSPG